jgi:hypothetical protein
MSTRPLLPWRILDVDGKHVGLVFAAHAIDAASLAPAGHGIYVGGPSCEEPDRPWWVDAWNAGSVDIADLLTNDPRLD